MFVRGSISEGRLKGHGKGGERGREREREREKECLWCVRLSYSIYCEKTTEQYGSVCLIEGCARERRRRRESGGRQSVAKGSSAKAAAERDVQSKPLR